MPRKITSGNRAIRTLFIGLAGVCLAAGPFTARAQTSSTLDKDWMARWEKNIVGDSKSRPCDHEMGEECGWLISPFLNGFYYGYLATHDTQWIDRLIDWADSWIARGIKEPDGFVGWPKPDGASTQVVPGLVTDNMLGDAMTLRPIVLMSRVILLDPNLKTKYGHKARGYLDLAEKTFQKWDSRGCWREVKDGGLWVVPLFGLDPTKTKWTDGYAKRATEGFSDPANKENLIAEWLMAMYDVIGKPVYKERAEKWWRQMKSRLRLSADGKYYVWNYWDPAGPWDYKADGSTKHWVGVHPNGGYYAVDVAGMVNAFEHGLVFNKEEIDRLIATNRDSMWNQQVKGARFQRIDGGQPAEHWKDSPGVLWTALVPYDEKLRQVFEANHNPDGWGGLSATPWYVARVIHGEKAVW